MFMFGLIKHLIHFYYFNLRSAELQHGSINQIKRHILIICDYSVHRLIFQPDKMRSIEID